MAEDPRYRRLDVGEQLKDGDQIWARPDPTSPLLAWCPLENVPSDWVVEEGFGVIRRFVEADVQ